MRGFKFHLIVSLIAFGVGAGAASLFIFDSNIDTPAPAALRESVPAPNQELPDSDQTVSEASDKVPDFRFPLPADNPREVTSRVNCPAADGKSVKVEIVNFLLKNKPVTDKPTDSISFNKLVGLCQIDWIRGFQVKGKIFAFQFTLHRTNLTREEENKWKGSPWISSIYVDPDGDGNFESLSDGSGLKVPRWAIK